MTSKRGRLRSGLLYLLLLLAATVAGALLAEHCSAPANAQGGGISPGTVGSLRYGVTVPGACVSARGEVFFKTVAPNAGIYQCISNAFAQLAGASSTVQSFNTRTGAVTLTSGDVTGALTFTPENVASKNASNGYAGLSGGKVANSQLAEVLSVTDLSTYATASGTGSTAILATFTGLASGHVLTWNGSNWINQVASGGITTLNTLTAATQTFAVGTGGSDFNISSATSTHTFNIPDAGTGARGLVTTGAQEFAGAKTFDYAAGSSFIWKRSTNRFAVNGNIDSFVGANGARIGWMSGTDADANAFPMTAMKSTVATEIEITDGDTGRGGVQSYGLRIGVQSKTTNYTLVATDFTILANATGGVITQTLPACVAGNIGRLYHVVKIDASANAVTVGRTGSDVINGATTVSLAAQYNSVTVVCGAAGFYYKIASL